jgi:hypothetical protein
MQCNNVIHNIICQVQVLTKDCDKQRSCIIIICDLEDFEPCNADKYGNGWSPLIWDRVNILFASRGIANSSHILPKVQEQDYACVGRHDASK